MSIWKGAFNKIDFSKVTESKYAEALNGAARMAAGMHQGVKLVSAKPVETTDYKAVDLIWENSNAESMKQRVFLTYVDKKTGEETLSTVFTRLIGAFANNEVSIVQPFMEQFVHFIETNPDNFARLVSCTATIKVGLPSQGFKISNKNDKMGIVDIETGEFDEEFGFFDTYEELRDHAKELKIYIAFNNVLSIQPYVEDADDNKKQLQTILEEIQGAAKIKVANAGDVGF